MADKKANAGPDTGPISETPSDYIASKEVADVDIESVPASDDASYPLPTEEEKATLRKVADSIPTVSFVICVVEIAERASYYGVKGVFNNFMQFPLPEGGNGSGAVPKGNPNGHAGALNKGLQFASAFSLLFTFLSYVIPILGGWLADTKLGRFNTILLGVLIGGFSHVIMVGGAAPAVLRAGNGVAPFVIGLFLLAIGAGIFKPNVSPTLVDQYTHQKQYVKTLKSGERVIVDPETTIGRIFLVFYSCINVGAFFTIATTYTEKYRGFWLAFLEPGIVYFVLPFVLWWLSKRIIKTPPSGSALGQFVKVTAAALKENKGNFFASGFWDKARPSVLRERGIEPPWSEKMVRDVERTFEACVIFLYFPIYNLNDGGIGAVATNQAAAMTSKGAPNDLLGNFNPLTIIIAGPILSHGVYPLLRRYHIRFGRINRMTLGFLLAAISGAAGAIVQSRVYATSPCGNSASTCDTVSPVSIWWQLPNVILGALSELLCNVTAYEMAYARAPPSMRSIVLALFLFTMALSSALAEILIPVIKDPHLVWVWAGPAIALVAQTVIFYWRHHRVNDDEFMTYDEDVQADTTRPESPVKA